jgi:hypothetical protein
MSRVEFFLLRIVTDRPGRWFGDDQNDRSDWRLHCLYAQRSQSARGYGSAAEPPVPQGRILHSSDRSALSVPAIADISGVGHLVSGFVS